MMANSFIIRLLSAAGVFIVLWIGGQANAADEYNCLMCHKHRYSGRIDENGKRWNYNVDEGLYNKSVHRLVECRDCHNYITRIPHDPITQVVDCANQCHIKPPFAQENFSHQRIIDIYNRSAHGVKPTDSEALKQAKPYCKFCHLNPIYARISEKNVDYEETLRRCYNCHPQSGVVQAYLHMTHRLRKKTSRSSREIIELCAKCHQDVDLMKNLKVSQTALDAVETYNQSIHGKLVRLGSQKAADCVSCHASAGLHDIYKKDDERATIYKENLMKTCHQCHETPTSWFAGIAVHPKEKHQESRIVFYMSIFLRVSLYGAVLSMVGMMLFETYGRRRDGIKLVLRDGTTWRGKSKRRSKKEK
ncbi:MAG: hypothetical protein JSW26_22455 [Desulfobacterales bacterium]|nr:MAG: hypothetical protein JSW26_22455 [Desulfobacterales bacterium]